MVNPAPGRPTRPSRRPNPRPNPPEPVPEGFQEPPTSRRRRARPEDEEEGHADDKGSLRAQRPAERQGTAAEVRRGGERMAFSFATPQQPQQQQPHQAFPQSSPFPQFTPSPAFPQPQPQAAFPSFQPQPQPQLQLQLPPQQPQFQFPQQPQPQAPQQQLYLFTVDKAPASYNTKWEELHPDSQKLLLQIEERILEYKDESQRLDQCSRLYDASLSNNNFELDANRIIQELGGISTAIEKQKVPVQMIMDEVNRMMWNTEVAVRSYMILRPRFLHKYVAATSSIGSSTQYAGALPSSQTTQPITSSVPPAYDFYSGLPKRPSPFMQQTADRFDKYLTECCQWIEELEQMLMIDTGRTSSSTSSTLSESLPRVMRNVHDYFIHVAAKVEGLHQYIESMKTAYMADQRRRGDLNDPFLEADRREAAKQEAAAKRVHPTLHLPSVPAQPSTQVTGLIARSPMPSSSAPLQPGGSTAPSSGSGFSIFSTPLSSASAASTSSSFLFSTPTASAPSSSIFGSSGFSPQSTAFGTASTSLFGSAQTPSLFGASTPTFASTPGVGSSSLFSTPTLGSVGTGAATGSGASFGAASRSARPKPRTSRR